MHTAGLYCTCFFPFKDKHPAPLPESYSLLLVPVDVGGDSLFVETDNKRRGELIVLNVIMKLQIKRLWQYRVLAYGCSQHPMTNLSELSELGIAMIGLGS